MLLSYFAGGHLALTAPARLNGRDAHFLSTETGSQNPTSDTSAMRQTAKIAAVACEVANAIEDVRATELEFDAISTDFAEPWLAATDHPAYG